MKSVEESSEVIPTAEIGGAADLIRVTGPDHHRFAGMFAIWTTSVMHWAAPLRGARVELGPRTWDNNDPNVGHNGGGRIRAGDR
jgi:hypothetical protein